jgi:membrane protein DedA with SNARE-associated domain
MAEDWFNRHGILVLLFGRFVPGIRPISAYSAGFARMKLALFLPLSLTGAFLWCLTFMFAGTLLGKHWERITWLIAKYNLFLAGFAAVVAVLYITWKVLGYKPRI